MTRDVARLGAETFDVLVVGGGIGGVTIAYDLALRGLAVALVEGEDFGSGTAFGCLPTLHVRRPRFAVFDASAREWVRERRTLARVAAYAVRPVAVALPLYRSLGGKLATRLHLLSERLISFDRNRDVPRSLHLPSSEVLSRAEASERFPGLRRQGLTGAALWYEYLPSEPDRLPIVWALAASRQGAVLANHVEVTALRKEGGRVVGAHATDRMNGRALELSARLVVDATGSDALRTSDLPARRWMRTVSLVTRRDSGDDVLGGRTRSGQLLFLAPWRGRALVGVWEMPWADQGAGHAHTDAELARWVDDANNAFPTLDLTPGDVTQVHVGRVCTSAPTGDQVADGIVSVAVANDWTARAVAERVTDLIVRKLGRSAPRCRTAIVPLPGGDFGDATSLVARVRRDYDAQFPSDTIPHLVAAYGSESRDVLSLAAGRSEWQARIDELWPVVGGQLIWAARHEMAVTLEDAIVRRTPIGSLDLPAAPTLDRAADVLGTELGWSNDERQREIAKVRASYARYGTSNALKT